MAIDTATRILLAEQDGEMAAAIRGVIASQAHLDLAWDVHETGEAIRLIEQEHPDVVVLSHNLLKAMLLSTIRVMTDESSRTKVLVISMHNDSRFALRAIEAGASGYVLEDRAFEELGTAVSTIMSGRTYVSPGIAGTERPITGTHGPLVKPSPAKAAPDLEPLEIRISSRKPWEGV